MWSYPAKSIQGDMDMQTKSIFGKVAMGLLVTTFVFCLAACNTMEGVGEDIEKGGENLQEAVE